MLSEKKALLRLSEIVAIAGSVAALGLAIHSYLRPDPDFPVLPVACVGMVISLLTFVPACMLGDEYTRTVRNPSTWSERIEGLSSGEIAAFVRWAPKPYIYAAWAGVAIFAGTAFKFGTVTFSEGQTVSPETVTGFALYFSVFFLTALPVLGSAVRMPGHYAQSDS